MVASQLMTIDNAIQATRSLNPIFEEILIHLTTKSFLKIIMSTTPTRTEQQIKLIPDTLGIRALHNIHQLKFTNVPSTKKNITLGNAPSS